MPFNAEQFLHTKINTPTSTETVPVPENEYRGVCGAPTCREVKITKGDNAGKIMYAVDIPIEIDSEEVRQLLGRPHPKVKYGGFLELTKEGGISDLPGDNVWLGRLREATDLNDKEFNLMMLQGQNVLVKVKHRDGPNGVYADASAVAHINRDQAAA